MFYEYFKNASYKIYYKNSTVVLVDAPLKDLSKYQQGDNVTFWWVGEETLMNLWSPDYWNHTVYTYSEGMYFNATS
jgi:hypothetical protein